MAQKVGINFNGIKEVKLGKTFNKGFSEEGYHTIRYDFKPASVDSQKVGSLEVVDKEVTLTFPLMGSDRSTQCPLGGGGSTQEAVFKGNKTPASKDCLLIIDHTTGEIILERITENIRVKKTRTEGGNRKMMQRGPVAQDLRPNKPSPSQNHSITSSPHRARPSPSHRSPPPKSPSHKTTNSSSSKAQVSSVTPGSMPMLNFEEEQKNDSIMSDSSSDSDSNSGSSSSSDSDSDSDTESRNEPTTQNYTANGHVSRSGVANNHKSPSSVLSDLELSEED